MLSNFTYLKKLTSLAVVSTAGIALSASFALAGPPAELGVWFDDSGNGAVEIYICQDRADRLCGRIVWLKDPMNAQGTPKRDRFNPKEEMQKRPICGLPMIGNLAKTEAGYDGGWIYDPKVGKTYDSGIVADGTDKLTVTGYIGIKALGKSFTWTRAPETLERCTPPS